MELVISELPPKNTLCLNMIVKNESKIIVDTLMNLCQYFKFDYWVICDTGSTDNTKELIQAFFLSRGILGELLEHEWVDFGHNRTQALACAFDKTDYLLIFDADDRLIGNFCMPDPLDKDCYDLKLGKGFEWQRPLLMTNRKRWGFKGVAHEYLQALETMDRGTMRIEGDYYVAPGTFGCRSQNPNKYFDDAIVLKNAFEKEQNAEDGDKGIATRYAFYCAQSYKDTGMPHESIEWYKKVVHELGNWAQEKYYACLMLGNLYSGIGDMTNAVKYWLKTAEYDSERIEGIVPVMEHYRATGDNLLVNILYHKFKNYNKNTATFVNKLFLDTTKYTGQIEYNNSICAFYANDKESGYECCKKIILNKTLPQNVIENTLSNIRFYSDLMQRDNFVL
jgi:glycosyltransferase involved in cell wall biosynthesis